MTEEEELIKLARIRYPVGTKFRSAYRPDDGIEYEVVNTTGYSLFGTNHITVNCQRGPSVWYNGNWADIVSRPVTESVIINTYPIW